MSTRRSWLRNWTVVGVAAGLTVIGVAFALLNPGFRPGSSGVATGTPHFVGSETCAGCHRAEAELWRTSQHRHAMDHATEQTVLGDFSGGSFEHQGVRSRFFRDAGRYMVETDGPDGQIATFLVKYTFGLDPLQQYLVELSDGRIQALSVAWDSRPKDKGGQRWFHLYPDEAIRHDDILHWTKLNQNWNFMCAECHSTGVRKNYDAAGDRFATNWAEISVGCEACHGQGSRHVAWGRSRQGWWPFGKLDDPTKGLQVSFDERDGITWPLDGSRASAKRSSLPSTLRKEVETCGLCHARRGQLAENWIPGRPLSETHVVATLARGLFHSDGQMQDEVYNYASFKQSRMFAAGVTCSDCHDPHSGKLRASGDGVCLQCHSADRFDAASHHRHAGVSPPLACASCHMPVRTYMVVDPRHDHGFRIPRPDLTVQLGAPNACNDCHAGQPPAWAAATIERWHGPDRKGFQTYAPALHSAWNDQAKAARLLAAVAADTRSPAIARASALAALGTYSSPAMLNVARTNMTDPDPMVRIAAIDMLAASPAEQVWPLVAPMLTDPVRGVRIRAASLLAAVPTARQPPADRDAFDHAAAEFVSVQRLNADRPESRSALGRFLAQRGKIAEAEAEYRAALRLSAQYAPAAVNLADLYRQLGWESESESVLRAAIAATPRDPGPHYALGLALVRMARRDEAIISLAAAAALGPDRPRYGYVFSVALHSAGRAADAIAALKENLARHPRDRESAVALASYLQQAGDATAALQVAEQLQLAYPGDPEVNRLVDALRKTAK